MDCIDVVAHVLFFCTDAYDVASARCVNQTWRYASMQSLYQYMRTKYTCALSCDPTVAHVYRLIALESSRRGKPLTCRSCLRRFSGPSLGVFCIDCVDTPARFLSIPAPPTIDLDCVQTCSHPDAWRHQYCIVCNTLWCRRCVWRERDCIHCIDISRQESSPR